MRFIAFLAALFLSTPALAQQSTSWVFWDGLEDPTYVLELPGDPGQNTVNFELRPNQKLALDYQAKRFCSMIEDRLLIQKNSDEDYFPEDACAYFLAFQLSQFMHCEWLAEELSQFDSTKIIRPDSQANYWVHHYQEPPPPPPVTDQDQDEDGILDREDACPHQQGPEQFRGCPRDDEAATGVLTMDSDSAVKASIYFMDGVIACDYCQDQQLNPGRKIAFVLPVGKYQIKTENGCHKEVIIFQERGPTNPLTATMNGGRCSQYTDLESDERPPSPLPPPPQTGLLVVYNNVRPEIRVLLEAQEVQTPLQFHGRRKVKFSYGPGELKIEAWKVGEEGRTVHSVVLNSSQIVYLEITEDREQGLQITEMDSDQIRSKNRQEKMVNTYGRFQHGPHLGYRYTRGNYSVGPSSPPSRQDTFLVGYGLEYLFLEFRFSAFLGRDRYMINPRFAGYQFQGQLNFQNMVWLGAGWMREKQGLGSPTGFRYSHDGYLFSFEMAPWTRLFYSDLLEVPRLGVGLDKSHGWMPNDSGKVEWRNVTYGYVYVTFDFSIFPR